MTGDNERTNAPIVGASRDARWVTLSVGAEDAAKAAAMAGEYIARRGIEGTIVDVRFVRRLKVGIAGLLLWRVKIARGETRP
jgi:hypothetical protein